MRKTFALLLAVIMVMTCLPLGVSASTVTCMAHQWVYRYHQDPTCLEPGSWYRICEVCGYDEDGETPALGHDFHWVTTRPATCTEWGMRQRVCSRCGAIDISEEVAPLGHDFVFYRVKEEATCTQPGTGQEKCSRCDLIRACEIPALGHDWGEWHTVVKPKPGKAGYEERECGRCHITEQRPLTAEDSLSGDGITLIWDGYLYSDKIVDQFGCYYTTVNNSDEDLTYEFEYAKHSGLWAINTVLERPVIAPGESLSKSFWFVFDEDDLARGYTTIEIYVDCKNQAGEFVTSNRLTWDVPVPGVEAVNKGYSYDETSPGGANIYFTDINHFFAPLRNVHNYMIHNGITYIYDAGNFDPRTEHDASIYVSFDEKDIERGYAVVELFFDADDATDNYIKSNRIKWEIPVPDTYHGSVEYTLINFGYQYLPDGSGANYYFDRKNNGTCTMTVFEDLTGYDDGSYTEVPFTAELQPGESYGVTSGTIIFSEEQLKKGTAVVFFYSRATDPMGNIKPSNALDWKIPVPTNEDLLTVTKEETSAPTEGSFYMEGEEIEYRITVSNNTTIPYYIFTSDVDNYGDHLLNDDEKKLDPGETVIYDYTHTVTAEDVLSGQYTNSCYISGIFYRNGEKAGSYIERWGNTVTVDCGGLAGDLTVVKNILANPENGVYFEVDDQIGYLITVTNNTNFDCYLFVDDVDDYGTHSLNEEELFAPGETKTYTYTHVVTAEDVKNGYYDNSAVVSGIYYPDGPDADFWYIEQTSHAVQALCGGVTGELTIEKDQLSLPLNGSFFVIDDSVYFGITVTNDTEYTYCLNVYDYDAYGSYELASGEIFEPGESKVFEYIHTVNAADVLATVYDNFCFATGYRYKDDPATEKEEVSIWGNQAGIFCGGDSNPDAALTVEYHGWTIDEGGLIHFAYDVVNTGHVTLHDVKFYAYISDALDVAQLYTGDWEPDFRLSASYVYAPTAEDYENEGVFIYIYAQGLDEQGNPVTSNKAYDSVALEGDCYPANDLVVTKKAVSYPSNGKYFEVGDPVDYKITVTNGTEMIYEIWVDDVDAYGVHTLGDAVTIAPGDVLAYNYTHIVTMDDVKAGVYENFCLVSGVFYPDGADGEMAYIERWGTPVAVDCGGADGELTLTKSILYLPLNGSYFEEGETVYFKLTVTNNANKCYCKIYVHDTDAYSDMILGEIDYLNPGDSASFNFEHKITAEEVLQEFYLNTGYLEAYDMFGEIEFIECNTVYVPTGLTPVPVPQEADIKVTKKAISEPDNGVFYQEGEEVFYQITVTNDSGVNCNCIEVYDPLFGSDPIGVYYDMTGSVIDVCKHIVTEDEAKDGAIWNQAYVDYTFDGEYWDIAYSELCKVLTGMPKDKTAYIFKDCVSYPMNGYFYEEGDLVQYYIYFKNTTNETISSVDIYDDLISSSSLKHVENLQPNEVVELYCSYYVKAEDIGIGICEFYNTAYAVYSFDGNDSYQVQTSCYILNGKGDDPVVPETPVVEISKTVVSSSDDPAYYVPGETVSYLITVTNKSETVIRTLEVFDYIFNGITDIFTPIGAVSELQPHETYSAGYSYVVEEWDADEGYLTNSASADFFCADENGYCLIFSDEVTVDVGRKPDRPVPPKDELPVLVKYVTNIPEKGYYEEGDWITYSVVLYNFTGRTFYDIERYDILLDTTGHLYDGFYSLDSTPVSMVINYQVDFLDAVMEQVSNTAWVTMKDEDGNSYTIYSNEVVVPTKPGPVPPVPPVKLVGTDYCIPTLVSANENTTVIKESYCTEHANLNAKVLSRIASAGEDEDALNKAYLYASAQWLMALESEYKILANEYPDAAELLEKDHNVFKNWLGAEVKLLESDRASETDCLRYKYEVLRDKCCELCYAYHEKDEVRKDSLVNSADAVPTTPGIECVLDYDDTPLNSLVSEKLCRNHVPVAKITAKLMNAIADKENSVKAAAWDRVYGYWKGELDAKFASMSSAENPARMVAAATDKVMFETVLMAQREMYSALYDGRDEVTNEVMARFVIRELIRLCEAIR